MGKKVQRFLRPHQGDSVEMQKIFRCGFIGVIVPESMQVRDF